MEHARHHLTTACSWQGAAIGLCKASTTCRLHDALWRARRGPAADAGPLDGLNGLAPGQLTASRVRWTIAPCHGRPARPRFSTTGIPWCARRDRVLFPRPSAGPPRLPAQGPAPLAARRADHARADHEVGHPGLRRLALRGLRVGYPRRHLTTACSCQGAAVGCLGVGTTSPATVSSCRARRALQLMLGR